MRPERERIETGIGIGTGMAMGMGMGIGEFSQLCGLSIDSLRRYHELGLLVPASVARNGYRRYTPDQLERASAIAALRAVDLPLDDVAAVLDAGHVGDRIEVLRRHRRRLTDQLATSVRRLADLNRLIDKETMMTDGVHDGGAEIRRELLAMFEEQQARGRVLFDATRSSRPDRFLFELDDSDRPPGYGALAAQSHDHAVRLDAIVREHGWPGRSLVGDDGAAAAWAIAQHADDDNDACSAWLPRLRDAVAAGEAAAVHYAALVDRVRLRDRRPQAYGTVVEVHAGGGEGRGGWRVRPPIDDEPPGLDARREAIGLPPISDFLASLPAPDEWYEGEAAAN